MCIGVYERRVQASITRVWENVLDWEHLPWLHRSTFAYVHLERHDARGWRAESALHDSKAFMLEVSIDRAARRYHSRTIAGLGAGSDIVTELQPIGAHTTDIRVEFRLPNVPPAHVEPIAAYYTQLYRHLWDEDEQMMRRRQALLDGPPPPPAPFRQLLGLRAALRLPLLVETPGGPLRIIDAAGVLHVHPTTCPHQGGPLDDAPVHDGCITCPWHGYRFDLTTGQAAGHALRLEPAARLVVDGDDQVTLLVE